MARGFDRRSFLKVTAGIAGGAALGLGSAGGARAQALDAIRKAGVLRVGYFQAPPLAFTNASGTLTGTSMDLLKRIVEQNNLPHIEPVLLDFDGLIPGLVANRFDMVACSMAIRAARCKVVDFSRPDILMTVALAVRNGNPLGLKSLKQFIDKPSLRLGGVSQTSEVGTTMAAGVPASQITLFPNDDAMVAALAADRVDAIVSVSTLLPAILQRNASSGVVRVNDFETPIVSGEPAITRGAYSFRKGVSNELIAIVNAGISEALASGWQAENLAKYGMAPSALPAADMTAAQICSA